MELRLLRYFLTVVEERHIGRAATRLGITQPPLSRAIRQLEDELGATLLDRTPQGVVPTSAGEALGEETRTLLKHVDRLQARVRHAAGTLTLAIGTLADTAEVVGSEIVTAFRRIHPQVTITVHEGDLSDPTAGLRTGLTDVAFTRTPFNDAGLRTHVLGSQAIGVVLRADDPLAGQPLVSVAELAYRRWIRLPEGTDPLWAAYWAGPPDRDGPVMRTIQECLQSVLWNGMSALAPLDQPLPAGLVTVPVTDRPPSHVVVASRDVCTPLVRSFLAVAARQCGLTDAAHLE